MRSFAKHLACATVSLVLAAQAPNIMPVQDIRPGMKGQGRTVFKGG